MPDKAEIARHIIVFLEKYGIDPIYAGTLFCVLIMISYWREYKNWDRIPDWQKGLAGSAAVAAITFTIISLLRFLGIINL